MSEIIGVELQTPLSIGGEKAQLEQVLQKLKIAEERSRIAAESSSEIIIEYNVLDNSVYHVTRRVEVLYGIPQTIKDAPQYLVHNGIIQPESVDDFMELFKKIRAGESKAECTIKTRPAAGGTLWAALMFTTIFNDEHQAIRAIGVLKDITRQKEAELQYENEALYRNAMRKDAILYGEADLTNGKVLCGLKETLEEKEVPQDCYIESLDRLCRNYIYPDDRQSFLTALSQGNLLTLHATGTDKLEIEYRRLVEGKTPCWVRCTVYLTDDRQGKIVKGLYYVHDIHAAKIRELEFKEKAERDLLTGLYNKVTTELMIKRAISAKPPVGYVSAFMIVDLDNFKSINDQLGHAFGDAVLSETAHKLQLLCREADDLVGRIGGDEFVLFMQNFPSCAAVESKAQTICDMFRHVYSGALHDCKISGSVGIAIFPDHGLDFAQLYNKADIALYAAKDRNKDTYCLYSDDLQNIATDTRPRVAIDQSAEKTFSENIIEYIFRILYESRDLLRVVNATMELVSNHFGFSRSYIFESAKGGDYCQRTFEWCAPGIASLPANLQAVGGEGLITFKKRFGSDGVYIMRSPEELPAPERAFPELREIQWRFQHALTDNGDFAGFVGFDQHNPNRVLTQADLSNIQIVAQMLDVFLSEKRTNDRLVESGTMLQAVADSLNTCTYIMDPETFRLRFVNQNTMKLIPEAMPGKICYEAIRGRQTPCEDCPVLQIVQGGDVASRIEFYNATYDLWFKLSVSMVKLADNRQYGLINCYDITEYKKRSEDYIMDVDAFTRAATLYNALCRSTDDYIYMCDMPNNLFYFPQAMVDEFDLPGQIIKDAIPLWSSRIHENERGEFFQQMVDMISGKTDSHCQEYRAINKHGDWVWLCCRGYLAHDDAGQPSLFAGILTSLGKKNKIDPLSGLQNKYEFEARVRAHLDERQGGGVLLLLGLDNFKNINNLYGWEFGDQIIRASSLKIQKILQSRVQVYRLDGDKFGIFFPVQELVDVEETFQEISSTFQRQQQCGEHRYYCTISGGYSIIKNEPVSFYTLFKHAEYALDYSKAEGKNRLTRYDAVTMSGQERILTLIERLRESVDCGFVGFKLFFQPQVEVSSHTINSAEALLRWRCDEYGEVSPLEFIPLLEQTRLIHPVGRWVIQQAAAVCKAWRRDRPNFTISVNLSFVQLQDKNFIPYLAQMLESEQIEPAAMHLEITESCILSGSGGLITAFEDLRKLGFQLEMDDFGTGYSSLEILKNAPTDVVKIDRAFVKDITTSDFDATFIQFVVALCHSVNIRVCLEGVETWEEYRLVVPMAIDLIQGYLFGRPQSRADFEAAYLSQAE